MNEELVSVIIPVYNVSKYLEECLDSVLRQTYSNIEIICVEDCSTDDSYTVLQKYKNQNSNIFIVRNEYNQGLSFSRNRGLYEAKGKYVYFLDSDDFIEDYAIEKLYYIAENAKADVVFFEYREYREENLLQIQSPFMGRTGTYHGVYKGLELLSLFEENNDIIHGVPFQFLNRKFLTEKNIKFIEGIYHEDVPFTFQVLLSAERALCIKKSFYRYRRRINSIMSTSYQWKNFQGMFVGIIDMIQRWLLSSINSQYTDHIAGYISMMIFYALFENERRSNSLVLEDHLCIENMIAEQWYQLYRLTRQRCDAAYGRKTYLCQDIIDRLKRSGTIYVYGAGKIARAVVKELIMNDVEQFRIVVTETEGNPEKVFGYKVYAIEEVKADLLEGIVIVAVKKSLANDIVKKLSKDQDIVLLND